MSLNSRILSLVFFMTIVWHTGLNAQEIIITEPIRFLALGDSYTIGASVPAEDRWPQQLFDSMAARGFETEKLTIIARTGWRTDDLEEGIMTENPSNDYNLVSLLIGVNDQYQGYNTDGYKTRFEKLLLMAVELAGGNKNSVFVLSIPDYAYTPFGQGSRSISEAIDAFNNINASIAQSYDIAYFDITPISREGLANPSLVAQDGLHPSGLMYSRWVSLILEEIPDRQTTSESVVHSKVPEIKVFPNPASDFIEFRLSGGSYEDYKIIIYNAVGQVIASSRSGGRSTILHDTSVWPPGIYYYGLINGSGNDLRGSFIIV